MYYCRLKHDWSNVMSYTDAKTYDGSGANNGDSFDALFVNLSEIARYCSKSYKHSSR